MHNSLSSKGCLPNIIFRTRLRRITELAINVLISAAYFESHQKIIEKNYGLI